MLLLSTQKQPENKNTDMLEKHKVRTENRLVMRGKVQSQRPTLNFPNLNLLPNLALYILAAFFVSLSFSGGS